MERLKDFQAKLTEFLTLHKDQLLRKIAHEKALSDALAADLKEAADAFKETWK